MENYKTMFLRNQSYLPSLLLFMFHFSSHLISSSPSSVSLDSPLLCNPHQSDALLQFKSTLTIDTTASWCGDSSYPKIESWKEGTDCCSSWDGVTCNEETGHVIELDLSCSQLAGNISSINTLFSPHIAPYLQRLNLAHNHFQGSKMSSQFCVKFGSSLTHLNLSNSRFDGNIPSEISHLSNLVSLDLSESDFSGNIPSEMSHLSHLVSLDLSYNSGLRVESDRAFESIAHNLTHLRILHLTFVNMSSVVHGSSSLMNMSSSLTSLRLDSCRMQGQFPASFLLRPNLQELSLSYNNFVPITSLPFFDSITPSNNLTVLDLSDTDLSSVSIRFLDFVGNLKSLRTLSLGNCNLRGSFLPSFENLTKLNDLDLSSNNFNGPIPASFCNMNQLFGLSLGDNQLNGIIPSCLFAMPMLETLRLHDNKLYGQIPKSLSKSVNLVFLDLSSNNLSGSFDFRMFLDLKRLESLHLSHNDLSSSTSTGYNLSSSLPSLTFLYLSSCNLTEFPFFLKALPNLIILDISNNKIEGPVPEWMFTVGDTDFSKNSPSNTGILRWKNILSLDFHSNMLQGPLPVPPPNIVFFLVSNNNFTGEIKSLVCSLTSLEVLDLSRNRFMGLIPQCLGNLSKLSVLNLGTNNLQGIIPDMFAKDNSLNYLILNKNQLRGRLPHSLSLCQYLEVLDVGHNLIEDTFPHWLEILSLLQVLVLRSNKFLGSINDLKSYSSFHNLRILDVSNNRLTGQLPTRLIDNLKAMIDVRQGIGNNERYMMASNIRYGSNYYSMTLAVKGLDLKYEKILTVMTTIDFSRNKFEGDIPKVIGKLGSLKGLNLSHNLLVGHIPPSMGDLANLEWLDLSSNKLVGQIPRELTNLGFLAFLSLSHNQLEGPIPKGKQFDTFGNDSYKENLGLCGFPLSKACKTNEEATSEKSVDSLDSVSGFNWEGAFVGYGCGIVFGVYMGYLVFSSRSPQWFVRMVVGKRQHGKSVKRSKKVCRRN